jgi:hypothetical protein
MAKQLKRMNLGGSSTGFNASTGKKMSAPTGRSASSVDSSPTNTTSGQKLNWSSSPSSYKKGGSVAAKKPTMTLSRKRK